MSIPQNKTSYILSTLKELKFTFVVILLTIFSIYQIRLQISKVNENIYNTNKMNSTREFYKNTYESLHEQIPNIIITKNIIAAALPPTEDTRDFIELLNTYGKKHSLDIQTNVGESQLETVTYADIPLRTLPISINASGPIDNIRGFIDDIEHVPYFFSILSLEERGIDVATKQRVVTIQTKLWTKPVQVITRMQSK